MNFPANFQQGERLVRKVFQKDEKTTVETTEWLPKGSPIDPDVNWVPPPLTPCKAGMETPYPYQDIRAFLGRDSLFPIRPLNQCKGPSFYEAAVNDYTNVLKHPSSDAWLSPLARVLAHPDFGGPPDFYGIPVNLVPPGTPLRPVFIDEYPLQSDAPDGSGYPIPDGAFVEGGSDQHLLVLEKRGILWEFWLFRVENGRYVAANVARWDTNIDQRRTLGMTSADAAGLPILAGLLMENEMYLPDGSPNPKPINHALRFTLRRAYGDHSFTNGASHFAPEDSVRTSRPDLIPYGTRFRLRQDVRTTSDPMTTQGLPWEIVKIAECWKKYGMVYADNGENFYFQGESSKFFNNDVLNDWLRHWTLGLFEAVDLKQPVITDTLDFARARSQVKCGSLSRASS